MTDRIFTRKQIAEHFSVNPLTVKQWERKGIVKAFCIINGRPRYKLEDFNNLSSTSKIGNDGK